MTQLYLDASELQQPQNCRGGLPLETYENDKTWHRMTNFWRNWKPLLFWTSVCQIQKLQRCTLDPFLDPFPKSRDCVRDFKHIIAHNLSRCCSWTSSAMVSIRPMQRAELRPRCNMMQIKSATFFSLHSCQRWSWFKVYIFDSHWMYSIRFGYRCYACWMQQGFDPTCPRRAGFMTRK